MQQAWRAWNHLYISVFALVCVVRMHTRAHAHTQGGQYNAEDSDALKHLELASRKTMLPNIEV